MLFRRRSLAASLSRPQRSCGIRLGLCEPWGSPVTALAAAHRRQRRLLFAFGKALVWAGIGSARRTKCPAPVQASARVAGERPRVPSKFSFKWEPEHASFLQGTPTHATCQWLSTSLVVAEGRTVDVLPKKNGPCRQLRAASSTEPAFGNTVRRLPCLRTWPSNDPHPMPGMRCPSPTYECQAVQPLQDALLRPRVPENTLGRGRPRQALPEN